MGHLRGKQIDLLLGYFVLVTLAENIKVYKFTKYALRKGLRPSNAVASCLPIDILEACTGSASRKYIGDLVKKGLLNGGVLSTTLMATRR